MRRFLPAALFLMTMGWLTAYGQQKPPTIVFDSLTKDFGQVTAGATLTHVFKFRNKGQSVLEIFQVRPT